MTAHQWLLTCEHGGNQVPRDFRSLFNPHRELLQTHRGWDPGTRTVGEAWSDKLNCPLHLATTTRLLVDLNRSESHRGLFSEITRSLSHEARQQILADYYRPHRQAIQHAVTQAVGGGRRVIHIAFHSFTPVWDGQLRNAEVGLLYDPRRPAEREGSQRWQRALMRDVPGLRVRLNYPYRGVADGLTTHLRRHFSTVQYVGIELEINQQIVLDGGPGWRRLQRSLLATAQAALQS